MEMKDPFRQEHGANEGLRGPHRAHKREGSPGLAGGLSWRQNRREKRTFRLR